LDFTFAHQVRALVYYHTENFTSGQDLLQAAQDDPLIGSLMMPETGLGESTFYEANANRGSQQMFEWLDRLTRKVGKRRKIAYPELGKLVAIDGSLIEAICPPNRLPLSFLYDGKLRPFSPGGNVI